MKTRLRSYVLWLKAWVKRSPLLVVGVLLLGLLALIVLSFSVQKESPTEDVTPLPRLVRVYEIGSQPNIEAIGQVEQTGSLTIVAQLPGIVDQVLVQPGDAVTAQQQVARLASNYYGGNALALQSSLARKQYEFAKDTRELQQETLTLQRSLAESNRNNADELRLITERSIGDTKDLISLNEDLLSTVDDTISTSTVSAEIQAAKQSKAQLLSALSQLRQALRASEYQAGSSNPPADLSRSQYDLTLRQLELQERSQELSVAVAKLQSQLAAVSAAQMYPATPLAGVVQRVHVKKGELVNPGTPLVTVYGATMHARLTVSLSPEQAEQISPFEQSSVYLPDGTIYRTVPQFVSQIPTAAGFITVEYVLPENIAQLLSATKQTRVAVPILAPNQLSSQAYVPLDAVHQSEQRSEVFVVTDGLAQAQPVQLGQVIGSYVQVIDGLEAQARVIIDRVVVDGQPVRTE